MGGSVEGQGVLLPAQYAFIKGQLAGFPAGFGKDHDGMGIGAQMLKPSAIQRLHGGNMAHAPQLQRGGDGVGHRVRIKAPGQVQADGVRAKQIVSMAQDAFRRNGLGKYPLLQAGRSLHPAGQLQAQVHQRAAVHGFGINGGAVAPGGVRHLQAAPGPLAQAMHALIKGACPRTFAPQGVKHNACTQINFQIARSRLGPQGYSAVQHGPMPGYHSGQVARFLRAFIADYVSALFFPFGSRCCQRHMPPGAHRAPHDANPRILLPRAQLPQKVLISFAGISAAKICIYCHYVRLAFGFDVPRYAADTGIYTVYVK